MPATPSMSLITWTRTSGTITSRRGDGTGRKVRARHRRWGRDRLRGGSRGRGRGGGIGGACVRASAAGGARVAIHSRTSRDRAEELASETGGVALQADLTVENESDGLFEAAEQELGGVDVCAAVAGFWPREEEPVSKLPLE